LAFFPLSPPPSTSNACDCWMINYRNAISESVSSFRTTWRKLKMKRWCQLQHGPSLMRNRMLGSALATRCRSTLKVGHPFLFTTHSTTWYVLRETWTLQLPKNPMAMANLALSWHGTLMLLLKSRNRCIERAAPELLEEWNVTEQ
jgi:hypothetical protein